MPNPKQPENLIGFVIGAAIALWLLYYLWVYVVGFLALCGPYYVYQEWKKANDRNRWH